MPDASPHAYLVRVGDLAQIAGLQLAELLHDALPDLRLILDCSGGGFANQLKRADKSGARVALVLGEDEAGSRRVGFKPLRNDTEQLNLAWDEVIERLTPWLE